MKAWNRVEDLCCVSCGAGLLSPKDSELMMCTECMKEFNETTMMQIKNKNARKGNVKRIRMKVPAFMVKKK